MNSSSIDAPIPLVGGQPLVNGLPVATTLLFFLLSWFVYGILANYPVDVHSDVAEIAGWSSQLTAPFKHPPLASWIFHVWFQIFPRSDWAAQLLVAGTVTAALAITFIVLRDHLDVDKSLIGLTMLTLLPLTTFHALKFNANTVQMPIWAAAILFFLRAHRSHRALDGALAGLFAALAIYSKYWGLYLAAGFVAAVLCSPERTKFLRSPAFWAACASGAALLLPYAVSLTRSSDSLAYVANLQSRASPTEAALVSLNYLCGSIAYVAVPLLILAALRPGGAALRDTVFPADPHRRVALMLFVTPLVLPALVNLALPHRLTPLWTFPNWVLLPVVLLGSPLALVTAGISRSCLRVKYGFMAAAVLIAPVVAWLGHKQTGDVDRFHYRTVAKAIQEGDATPRVRLLTGTPSAATGPIFYLPGARTLQGMPSDAGNLAAIGRHGLIYVCHDNDPSCLNAAEAYSQATGGGLVRKVVAVPRFPVDPSRTVTYSVFDFSRGKDF